MKKLEVSELETLEGGDCLNYIMALTNYYLAAAKSPYGTQAYWINMGGATAVMAYMGLVGC